MTTAADITNKGKALNNAGKQNQELNREHLIELGKFYEHLCLYSAGAISLSITFIGYIISSKTDVLNKIILGVKVTDLLYLSWLVFVFSFISSLLVKKYNAYYMSAFGMSNYTKHYKEFCEVQVEYLESNSQDVIFESGNLQDNLNMQKSNLDKINKAHQHNLKNEQKYFNLSKILKFVAEYGVFAGVLLLVIFSIIITNSLIK